MTLTRISTVGWGLLISLCLWASSARVGHTQTAADFRRMADHAVVAHQYDQAADYYRQEAQIYDRLGDHNGATVERLKADRWATGIAIYSETPDDANPQKISTTHAKFEPEYGCYLAAYVEADDQIRRFANLNHDTRTRPEIFGDLIHKPLAVAWNYCNYGSDFPLEWARTLLRRGIVPQIALEPNHGLNAVRNNDYLQKFARDAAACEGPVFLRFAGEMNGDWTAWHANPDLYRTKFRLMHDVMELHAPNVAMIWCVNHIPHDTMDRYYPGDFYVDWVGVNFYSVLHHDNNSNRPAMAEHPASLLRYVYDKYSTRKPIAICEYGASHQESLNRDRDYSDVAMVKFAELMSALPRQFPRVKMVGLYDSDNLTARFVRADRRLNNYSITDTPSIRQAVSDAVASGYFLSQLPMDKQSALPSQIVHLVPGTILTQDSKISVWVNTYDLRPSVILSLDGKVVSRQNTPGTYSTDLQDAHISPGLHTVHVEVLDAHGHHAGAMDTSFVLKG